MENAPEYSRTDYEFITKSSMRTIIKETKQSKQEEKKI